MGKPSRQPVRTSSHRTKARPSPEATATSDATPPTSRSQVTTAALAAEEPAPIEPLSAELGSLSGDPELDAFLTAECAKPAFGEPLPESSEPTSAPLSTSTLWVLACERPATPAAPRACWYWTADGWCDESDRHLAIPFRDEPRAQAALDEQGEELRMFEGWIGGVAAPVQRFAPRAGS